MARKIDKATPIKAGGNLNKVILEVFGNVNTGDDQISIAHMKSPAGWEEPGQTPDFDEYTYVLKGCLHVQLKDELLKVNAGEAIQTQKGEWVQYSSPEEAGAEYIAVCLPAFSPELAHRDEPK